MKIKKEDNVVIIAGKDKGKSGKVRRTIPSADRVIVEGINVVKRHLKKGRARQAGIVEMEAPLAVSKVMLVCGRCNQPTRVGYQFLASGEKARFCKKCGEIIGSK
ncbi:MAG: 50S ribosomal protein L24 [Chloroflexi bacterium]|nr:50S ribosomal protein L24 [Chloroflexota bacterium]